MEIINSPVEDIYLKYTEENVWKIYFLDELHDLDKNDYRVGLSLLPFLEMGRENVLKNINNKASIECFPDKLIVDVVFTEALSIGSSNYWTNLAFQWLVEMSNYDANLYDADLYDDYLRKIAFNKDYGQKLRHSILKFLKKRSYK
ncbi:hypothetical protein [Acinetobacter rudis]|uniref:hypothetical protein n=1 Tax=Acinetobacter rudis TaxID=632955 RepID=UPI00333E9F34